VTSDAVPTGRCRPADRHALVEVHEGAPRLCCRCRAERCAGRGLLLSLSGPSPFTTQSVNFEPSVVTSQIDRGAQGHGVLRVSGTTTASTPALPSVNVFALDSANTPAGTRAPVCCGLWGRGRRPPASPVG
jgi:hypothetical protein